MTETYSVTLSTYVAFSTVGAAFLLYGALGRLLDRISFSSAMFFLIAGIVASPIGFGTIPTEAAGSLLRIYAEVTLAIVLCTESARMDFRALRRGLITPARLITVALAGTGRRCCTLGLHRTGRTRTNSPLKFRALTAAMGALRQKRKSPSVVFGESLYLQPACAELRKAAFQIADR